MATLYISEYSLEGFTSYGPVPIALEPSITDQTVAISGSSTQSVAFNTATRFIRVHTDVICSIAIGANPTATTAIKRLPADTIEYFAVAAGHKLAVITNT